MAIYYILLFCSALIFSLQFLITKQYQRRNGTGFLDYGLPLLLKEAKGEVTYESETEKYDEKQVEMYYKLDELLMEIVNLLEEVITNEIINKSILCSLFNERVRELGDTSTSGKILSDGFLRDTPKYLENYERTELRRLRAKRQEKENKCKQNT